jgi:hypothetical protein
MFYLVLKIQVLRLGTKYISFIFHKANIFLFSASQNSCSFWTAILFFATRRIWADIRPVIQPIRLQNSSYMVNDYIIINYTFCFYKNMITCFRVWDVRLEQMSHTRRERAVNVKPKWVSGRVYWCCTFKQYANLNAYFNNLVKYINKMKILNM